MKFCMLIGTIAVLCLLLAGCGGGRETAASDSMPTYTFTSDTKGFSIRYPKTWILSRNTDGFTMLATEPSIGADDPYQENFGVVAVDLEHPVPTLESYHLRNIGALTLQVADFHFIASGDATVDHDAAKWLTFTYTYHGQTLTCLEYESLHHDRAYVTICSALPETFASYDPLFTEFAHTLQISDSRTPAGQALTEPSAPGPYTGIVNALVAAGKAGQ